MFGVSLFAYRPWYRLFRPFGLVGWLWAKISLFRIQVQLRQLLRLPLLKEGLPSTFMGTILLRDRVLPDRFACGSCMHACPIKTISLSTGKRNRPPARKFKPKTSSLGQNGRPCGRCPVCPSPSPWILFNQLDTADGYVCFLSFQPDSILASPQEREIYHNIKVISHISPLGTAVAAWIIHQGESMAMGKRRKSLSTEE